MEVIPIDDARTFREQADPLLLEDEARNNLILGVTRTVIDRPDSYDGFESWVVADSSEVLAAAARTPPWNLILAEARSAPAVELLADSLPELPGVVGNQPWVDVLVASTSNEAEKKMSQGIFELVAVTPPEPALGTSRVATSEHLDLLVSWALEFQKEATGEVDAEMVERAMRRRVDGPPEQTAMWVHEVDDTPVSMSGNSGPTPNGIRIGPVYTPPEHRGCGYASTLVATQSQWLLDHGHRFCFLYTDLANPTSNAIYQRLGYRQIAESAEYSFSPKT